MLALVTALLLAASGPPSPPHELGSLAFACEQQLKKRCAKKLTPSSTCMNCVVLATATENKCGGFRVKDQKNFCESFNGGAPRLKSLAPADPVVCAQHLVNQCGEELHSMPMCMKCLRQTAPHLESCRTFKQAIKFCHGHSKSQPAKHLATAKVSESTVYDKGEKSSVHKKDAAIKKVHTENVKPPSSKIDKTAANALWLKKEACKMQLENDCKQKLHPWWKCMKCVHEGLSFPNKRACTMFTIQDQDDFCHHNEKKVGAVTTSNSIVGGNSSRIGRKIPISTDITQLSLKDISIKHCMLGVAGLLGVTAMLMLSWSNNEPTLEEMEAAARLDAIHGTGSPKKRDGPGSTKKGKLRNSPACRDHGGGGYNKYQVSRTSLTEPRRRSLTSALALEV
jgi:hypothetical protein